MHLVVRNNIIVVYFGKSKWNLMGLNMVLLLSLLFLFFIFFAKMD